MESDDQVPAMKRMLSIRIMVPLLACAFLVALSGCGSRVEVAVAAADSTLVYAGKEPGAPAARITFCSRISKKTGKLIGAGQVFTIREKAKVQAVVEIENPDGLGKRELMFHLMWLGPGSQEFFTKRIDVMPGGSTVNLESAVSIPPSRREPGEYALQVYLFRELIAEKRFELLGEDEREARGAVPPRDRSGFEA